jgi:hypothetical protein
MDSHHQTAVGLNTSNTQFQEFSGLVFRTWSRPNNGQNSLDLEQIKEKINNPNSRHFPWFFTLF